MAGVLERASADRLEAERAKACAHSHIHKHQHTHTHKHTHTHRQRWKGSGNDYRSARCKRHVDILLLLRERHVDTLAYTKGDILGVSDKTQSDLIPPLPPPPPPKRCC
jgi:hypothetical protein